MENPFYVLYDPKNENNKSFADMLYVVIYNYVLNTYKDKSNNTLMVMFKYKLNKIVSYLDSESPLYDPTLFTSDTGTIEYKYMYDKIKDVFSNRYWDDLKKIEIKRQSVRDIKEPNTNILCKKCNIRSIYVYEKQVRSSDEAMTQFYSCLNCGNKWSF
jgi:DNA-directed RNA polymerase subunit M/transcription elongation factor TFIIS